MKNASPAVSIVMPVYNGERFLKQAIDSILEQTFPDFEFIIINDGSSDGSDEIIRSYEDKRIVYLNLSQNVGLSKAINLGIEKASGRYIARMDADDIARPDRLKIQFDFLEAHPEIGIIGSSIQLIDDNSRKLSVKKAPTEHLLIKWQSLFSTPLFHPTIMARAQILKENRYDESLHNSEDYELWSRLLFTKSARFANVKETLISYRVFPESFTQKLNVSRRTASAENTIRNIEHYLKLNQAEKTALTDLRSEKALSPLGYILILKAYFNAAIEFVVKERPNPVMTLAILEQIPALVWFLTKHALKRMLRKAR